MMSYDLPEAHHSSLIIHHSDLLKSRSGIALVSALIALLFLAPRLALLSARDVFFDEIFTQWISGQTFAGIVHALRLDSGPPLYYFVVHLLGDPSAFALRCLSLVFAAAALVAILVSRRLGTSRFLAAALLAVYPPAIFASADARAYALCALFVTIAVLSLDAHRDFTAALALVVAAYAHYYGAFFFPILLLRKRVVPFAVAVALFAPWLPIALQQPAQATEWLHERMLWQPIANLSFAGRYPESLFAPASWAVVLIALFLLGVAGSRVNRFAAITAVPIAVAVAIGLAFGRTAYFPMRFESVIAPPLVLWLASSLESMKRSLRFATAGLLMAIGILTATNGIVDHARRGIDDYRAAAMWVGRHAPNEQPVVATGYLFLETLRFRPVIAFPAEQAQHPGWRATHVAGSALPAATFLWVGERNAPELAIIARGRRVEPLYINARAMVARVR